MGMCILFLLLFFTVNENVDFSNNLWVTAMFRMLQQCFFVEIYTLLALGAKKNVCINNIALDAIM